MSRGVSVSGLRLVPVRGIGVVTIALVASVAGGAFREAAAQRATSAVHVVTLSAPLAEHPEPLSQPGAILELRDGRVLVVDTKDRLVFLYDFAEGTATQVSRQGGGPLEYQFPAGLFASGDSIIVVDMLQQRLLILDAQGTPMRTHRLTAGGDATTSILKVGAILALDAAGRFYSESRGVTIVQGKMPTMSDTVALVRWATVGVRGDTIATRVDPQEMPKMGGSAQAGLKVTLPMTAFRARDAWTVFPSGRVAVARADDYHVEWVEAVGRKTTSARIPYTPIPVTEQDKARARKETREAAAQGLKLGASMAAGSGQAMPKIAMDVEEPAAWPKVKPPFTTVRGAPDGRLWVVRSTTGGSRKAEYDVIAADGRLERRVRTPDDVTLIGFGRGVLYGIRKDEDDLRYLQRYRQP